eukprot:CAMPEP_0194132392 /NCGR_PEP_ID=MMETSP0152-20130528/2877_1 /TAXON_ID=1049557 /ORGANISM="Thalassiothrix antarctica, Strain L6-D1" /LENGTH=489 /DNA_ID=CAMNT_0038827437 /DNA_START=83 /DNA_END=1553 /DNA_ORIENTATION=+
MVIFFIEKTFFNGEDPDCLVDELPHIEISTNPYELEAHGRGESYHPIASPSAVVNPSSVDEVIQVINLCSKYQIPIIPYGAGTSVEGHICAIEGGISMDMAKFDSIELYKRNDGILDPMAKVGSGVTKNRLNDEVRHSGMQFVVDPGADATIGGMTACGASGTSAVKYGSMRNNILGLECVLPDGTFVKCGTAALKNSAGYDLTSLITGSEGTLGVITSVLVKLHPIPEHIVSALCVFDDLFKAAEAVAMLKLRDSPLARCELLDKTSISAFNRYSKTSGNSSHEKMEEKPTLFLEFHGYSKKSIEDNIEFVKKICVEDYDALNFTFTSGEEERKSLWAARHNLYYASISLRKGATGAIVTDACVPLSSFARLMTKTAEDIRNLDVVGPCFGHAGDGNFHCVLPVLEDDSEDYLGRLQQVNDNLIRRALEAGGTCSGEHGIGYGKIKYLSHQYGSGGLHMMKLIKHSLDPNNIMNPGKILPSQLLAKDK